MHVKKVENSPTSNRLAAPSENGSQTGPSLLTPSLPQLIHFSDSNVPTNGGKPKNVRVHFQYCAFWCNSFLIPPPAPPLPPPPQQQQQQKLEDFKFDTLHYLQYHRVHKLSFFFFFNYDTYIAFSHVEVVKSVLWPNIEAVKVKLNVPQSSGSEGSLCYMKQGADERVLFNPKERWGAEGACEGGAGGVREGFWRNIPSEEVLTSNFTWVLGTLIGFLRLPFFFFSFWFCFLPSRRIIPARNSLLK